MPIFSTVLTLLLLSSLPGFAQTRNSDKDEAAVREIEAGFVSEWNHHDAKALSMFWAEEGDFVSPRGGVRSGRAEIEAALTRAHATRWKEARMTSAIRAIRFPTSDVAVVDGSFAVSGVHDHEGTPLPPVEGLYTWVLVKRNGKWEIFADRLLRVRLKWPSGPDHPP